MHRSRSPLQLLGRVRWLPAWVLAVLLLLGLLLEATVHDTLLWQSKLPLAVLLAALAWKRRRPA